jgi:fumarylacetoacetase
MRTDATHDPALRSWVASANAPASDFPIQNLPFGRFRRAGSAEPWRIGVAIGDAVLDLRAAREQARWPSALAGALDALAAGDLNAFMAAGPGPRRALRAALSQALAEGSAQQGVLEPCLVAQSAIELTVPCAIGDYTDFYTGIHHATAVGRLFRPDSPLLPNYQWVPIGYHGRSSSIVASGTPVRRPLGQLRAADAERPSFGPTQRLDYEVELGFLVGQANALGEPVPIGAAEDHLFGVTLFNDWSARDIQAWEYQPLGPFLAKSFCSTISPWIVTAEAMEPFRAPQAPRPDGDPKPLDYLWDGDDQTGGALDLQLEAFLLTPAMRAAGLAPHRLSRGNALALYWTPAQLVAHHSCGGCNLRPGDLLGTGTISTETDFGSLLEITRGGREPLTLPGGETRRFLEDGDEVVLTARASRPGHATIGFGECRGVVSPALAVR